jgi:hypothetical protein
MNPMKETGREHVYGNFGINDSGKSDGWHGDIEAIIAEYEASSESKSKIDKTCDKLR